MIYLLNGSIGDFLMVLYFMNTLSFVDGGEKFSCIISTPKSVGNYKELAKSYPHISIVKQNIMTMFQNISKGNIVIVPPTPGKNPIHIVLFARILTLFGGRVIGFRDRSRINSFFYETIISFNPKILFIELLFQILPHLKIKPVIPRVSLDFPKKEIGISRPYIVVHPFGSSDGRSILGSKLDSLLENLLKIFSKELVLVTGSVEDSGKISFKNERVKNVAGKYDLSEMPSVLDGADLYIGVDTGITHLASVLHKRSIVIAEQGTPHWLPYYNPQATIIYTIKGDMSGIHHGRDYLEAIRPEGVTRYLDRVSIDCIIQTIKNAIHE